MKRILIGLLAFLPSALCSLPSSTIAQQALIVKALAEKKVTELPGGPLFRRLENFPTLAQAAAGPTDWPLSPVARCGSSTVHTHPGSEAFYVIEGEQSIRTPQGVIEVKAGQPEAGPASGTPLRVSSSSSTYLRALVMFMVDATKPFSTPAILP